MFETTEVESQFAAVPLDMSYVDGIALLRNSSAAH
jgi:hypothetical protein